MSKIPPFNLSELRIWSELTTCGLTVDFYRIDEAHAQTSHIFNVQFEADTYSNLMEVCKRYGKCFIDKSTNTVELHYRQDENVVHFHFTKLSNSLMLFANVPMFNRPRSIKQCFSDIGQTLKMLDKLFEDYYAMS